jgi:hypothetical protein
MKHRRKRKLEIKENKGLGSIRTIMKIEGKFLHGTRGKETRGVRGNKKY